MSQRILGVGLQFTTQVSSEDHFEAMMRGFRKSTGVEAKSHVVDMVMH
jgi:hypothetical protein